MTRKKTEAKRQIALLSGLLKLRQARVTALTATGKNISQQQTEAFNSVIGKFKLFFANCYYGKLNNNIAVIACELTFLVPGHFSLSCVLST